MNPLVRTLPLLALTLAACGLSVPGSVGHPAKAGAASCLQAVGDIDVQTSTVLQMQQALREGRISSEQLVGLYLQRIRAFDVEGPRLNAIRALAPDALEQARAADRTRTADSGPLHGIPILLKDNIGTTDLPTTAGSIALAGNIPRSEAFLTQQLRAAGAIVLGKANLSEFANWVSRLMPNGYSSLGGQVISPYDFAADPLGSSTGSAVAGTMALAAMTVGSETSGSIISPAQVHSMVGVKPTVGLVSRAGIIPLAPSFDTAGPITRNVTDAAILLGGIAGVDARDPATQTFADSALRGRVPDYAAQLSPDALRGARLGVRALDQSSGGLFAEALAVLQAQGAEIITLDDINDFDFAASLLELPAIFNEFKTSLNHYLDTEAGPGLPAYTLTGIILFNAANPDKVKYGQDLLIASNAQTGIDADPVSTGARIAAQTAARALLDRAIADHRLDAIVAANSNNTGVTAAAGYPNITVPMGYEGQAPQGIAFAGLPYTEARLLALAYAYEQATRLRRPATELNPALAAFCAP